MHFAGCGLALIFATMTRPDGAIFYACASLAVVLLALRQRRWGTLIGFALPFVVVYGPYFFWKLSYYGHPFPNTFYAKSASKPYLDQGLWYVWLRSEEHTSELQSQAYLVCRLLLEKKNIKKIKNKPLYVLLHASKFSNNNLHTI